LVGALLLKRESEVEIDDVPTPPTERGVEVADDITDLGETRRRKQPRQTTRYLEGCELDVVAES
jgi:hypothetical protein